MSWSFCRAISCVRITYLAMTRRGSDTSSVCAPLIISSQHSLQKSLSSIRRCSNDRRAGSILRWHITHSVVLDFIPLTFSSNRHEKASPIRVGGDGARDGLFSTSRRVALPTVYGGMVKRRGVPCNALRTTSLNIKHTLQPVT